MRPTDEEFADDEAGERGDRGDRAERPEPTEAAVAEKPKAETGEES